MSVWVGVSHNAALGEDNVVYSPSDAHAYASSADYTLERHHFGRAVSFTDGDGSQCRAWIFKEKQDAQDIMYLVCHSVQDAEGGLRKVPCPAVGRPP